MEYTDFRVSSSGIGSLLGAFGGNSRFHTLCKIWDKSTFKDTYREYKSDEWTNWDADMQHIRSLGIAHNWKELNDFASVCASQSHIQVAHDTAYDILFKNQYVMQLREKTIAVLHSPGVVAAIRRVFSGPREHYAAVQELRQKRAELGLDHIAPFIKLLEQSSKLCASMTSRATRAYGVQGESTFIKAHNSAYRVPIEPVDRLYSKTMANIGGATWCVDGRIDGLKNNTIIEIKHRRDDLMEQIPIYELIQLHAYMFLLDRKQAIWYQCVSNCNLPIAEQRTVEFSASFWQSVTEEVTKCLQFICYLHRESIARRAFFLLSAEARDQVMSEFMGHLPTTN
jgi:hypothetical protein